MELSTPLLVLGCIIPISQLVFKASRTILRYRGSKILSGNLPEGRRRAPGNGNTGIKLGKFSGEYDCIVFKRIKGTIIDRGLLLLGDQ